MNTECSSQATCQSTEGQSPATALEEADSWLWTGKCLTPSVHPAMYEDGTFAQAPHCTPSPRPPIHWSSHLLCMISHLFCVSNFHHSYVSDLTSRLCFTLTGVHTWAVSQATFSSLRLCGDSPAPSVWRTVQLHYFPCCLDFWWFLWLSKGSLLFLSSVSQVPTNMLFRTWFSQKKSSIELERYYSG